MSARQTVLDCATAGAGHLLCAGHNQLGTYVADYESGADHSAGIFKRVHQPDS